VTRGADPRAWPGWVRRRVDGSSENDASSSATRKSLLLTSKSEMLTSKSLLLTSKSEMLTSKSLFLTSKSEMLASKSLFLTSKSEMLTSKSLFLTSKSEMLTRKSNFLITDVDLSTTSARGRAKPCTRWFHLAVFTISYEKEGRKRILSGFEPRSSTVI